MYENWNTELIIIIVLSHGRVNSNKVTLEAQLVEELLLLIITSKYTTIENYSLDYLRKQRLLKVIFNQLQ